MLAKGKFKLRPLNVAVEPVSQTPAVPSDASPPLNPQQFALHHTCSPVDQVRNYQQQQPDRNYRFNLWTFDEIFRTPQMQKQKQQVSSSQQKIRADFDMLQDKYNNVIAFSKDSNSPSHIYKGTSPSGESIYVKAFSIPQTVSLSKSKLPIDKYAGYRMLYEKEVYRRIRAAVDGHVRSLHLTDDEREGIRTHFIRMIHSIVNPTIDRYYIVTEDTGGQAFKDMKPKLDSATLKKMYFEILYILYLLRKLKIIHNDLHPGNIIVVKDGIPTKTFRMYDKEYTLTNYPYHLVAYDFDMSSIYGATTQQQIKTRQNTFLQTTTQKQNICAYLPAKPDQPCADIAKWFNLIGKDRDAQIISFVEYTPSDQQATPQQKKGNYYINCRLESNVQNYWNMVLRPVQKQVVKQQQKYYE